MVPAEVSKQLEMRKSKLHIGSLLLEDFAKWSKVEVELVWVLGGGSYSLPAVVWIFT